MEQHSPTTTPVGRVAARVQSILSMIQESGSHELILYDTDPPYTGNFEVTSIDSHQDADTLYVRIAFAFTATTAGDEPQEFYKIAAQYLVTYNLIDAEEIEEEDRKQFAKVNGMLNANPYWREYVHSCLSRSNMPPLPVPVYNPVPRDKLISQEPATESKEDQ